MRLWWWSVIVLMALSGCATAPPQGPVTTPAPTIRPLAWVLWEETLYRGALATTWTLYVVYERLAECEEQAYKTTESVSKSPDVLRGDYRVRYVCLPDTMDPRR